MPLTTTTTSEGTRTAFAQRSNNAKRVTLERPMQEDRPIWQGILERQGNATIATKWGIFHHIAVEGNQASDNDGSKKKDDNNRAPSQAKQAVLITSYKKENEEIICKIGEWDRRVWTLISPTLTLVKKHHISSSKMMDHPPDSRWFNWKKYCMIPQECHRLKRQYYIEEAQYGSSIQAEPGQEDLKNVILLGSQSTMDIFVAIPSLSTI